MNDAKFLKARWFYFTLAVIFLSHQYFQKVLGFVVPWANAYLDDLLAMPLILGLWEWERSLLWGLPALKTWEIVGMTILIFILFEGFLPEFSTAYTRDYWDGLCYAIGAVLFWVYQKKAITKNN